MNVKHLGVMSERCTLIVLCISSFNSLLTYAFTPAWCVLGEAVFWSNEKCTLRIQIENKYFSIRCLVWLTWSTWLWALLVSEWFSQLADKQAHSPMKRTVFEQGSDNTHCGGTTKAPLDCSSSPSLICYDCTTHIPFASASGAETPSRLSITAFISLTGPYISRLPPTLSRDSPVFFLFSLSLSLSLQSQAVSVLLYKSRNLSSGNLSLSHQFLFPTLVSLSLSLSVVSLSLFPYLIISCTHHM